MPIVGSLNIIGSIDTKNIDSKLTQVNSKLRDTENVTASAGSEFHRMGGILKGIGGVAVGVAASLLAVFTGILFQLPEWTNSLKEFWDNLKALFSGIWSKLKPYFEDLTDWIDELGVKFSEDAGFRDFITGAAKVIGAIALIGGAIRALKFIFSPIIALFSGIWKFIKPVWTKIAGFFKLIWAKIAGIFSGGIMTILGFFSNIAVAIWGVIDIFRFWGKDTGGVVMGIIKVVGGLVTAILVALGIISGGWAILIAGIIVLVAWLTKVIINNWDEIVDYSRNVWNRVREITQTIMGNIVGVVKTSIDNIKNFFNSIWDKAREVWNNILNFFKQPITATIDFFGGGSGGGGMLSGLGDSVANFFSGLFPSAQTGGYVTGTGLVNVHKGEVIAPTEKLKEVGSTGNITINITTGDLRQEADIEKLYQTISKRLAEEMLRKRRGGAIGF